MEPKEINLEELVQQNPVAMINTERLKNLWVLSQEIPTKFGNPLIQIINALVDDIIKLKPKESD